MKTSILTLLAAAGFAAAAFAAPVADATPEGEAKIISYNIRLGVADDGANSWEHRREATLRMLEREAPTVFGIQEGYLFQVKYIEENLPQYGRVGVGRDDRSVAFGRQFVERSHAQRHGGIGQHDLGALFDGAFGYLPCDRLLVERAENDSFLPF